MPRPAARSTSMRPSCASMILRTIARPRPEPCGLVVKNGLKIRSVRSGGMPGPLSRDFDHDHRRRRGSSPPHRLVLGGRARPRDRRRRPRRSSASNALVRRLVNSWRSWCGSPWIGGSIRSAASTSTLDIAARHLAVGQRDRVAAARRRATMRSTCSRIGRTNSSTSRTMALAILASLMMSVSSDCASWESGSCRSRRPAITSMPASGFFTSCAMAAAISPSAASRSRSRSRSSSCSTRVRSLKNSVAPIDAPSVVADVRQRVADHLARFLQPQLGAVGQVRQARTRWRGCGRRPVGPSAPPRTDGPCRSAGP